MAVVNTLREITIRILYWVIRKLDKPSVDLWPVVNSSDDSQVPAPPPIVPKRVPEAEIKPVILRRPTYAQAQALWEWEHNKRAQAEVERQQSGFF